MSIGKTLKVVATLINANRKVEPINYSGTVLDSLALTAIMEIN